MEKKPIWKSRKLWIAVIDALTGVLTIWLYQLFPEETATNLFNTYLAIQPAVIILIGAIAYEDGKALEANSHPAQMMFAQYLDDARKTDVKSP